MEKNIFRLQGLVGGISKINVDRAKTNVKNVISVLIVTDFIRERKSIMEAKKKGVPIIALCNTNCYVDDIVDHVIPINTNSIRSIILVIGILFDALRQGQEQFINRDCEEILTSINNIIATNSANTSDSKDNLVEATTNTMINHKKKIRSHE
jgi:ribosomal protein S2